MQSRGVHKAVRHEDFFLSHRVTQEGRRETPGVFLSLLSLSTHNTRYTHEGLTEEKTVGRDGLPSVQACGGGLEKHRGEKTPHT